MKILGKLGLSIICGIAAVSLSIKVQAQEPLPTGKQDREFWVQSLTKIADPVLTNLANETLKQNMPCEALTKGRESVTHLEAVGRLACGMAPWLELGPDNTEEGKLRKKYIDLTVKGLKNAVNPKSPDYLNFNKGSQPLVDAAFLAQALCRAPKQLWGNLDREGKQMMIEALKSSRKIKPHENNWLLFATMVEGALLEFTGDCDKKRLMHGIDKFRDEWYKGDGHYGDGPDFHMDYYNSFVIHPMLMDTLIIMKKKRMKEADFLDDETKRFTRYAEQQERLISPEGTFPAVGRSLPYRFGAFQVLAQAALIEKLPKSITPAQVRCAMTAVIRRQIEAPGTFDEQGWLKIGFAGSQKGIAESYISTGSLYLCSVAFLPLGLPEKDAFWSTPFQKWTNMKAWSGEPVKADHSIK